MLELDISRYIVGGSKKLVPTCYKIYMYITLYEHNDKFSMWNYIYRVFHGLVVIKLYHVNPIRGPQSINSCYHSKMPITFL